MVKRLTIKIYGDVQGVNFRYGVRREAIRLGILGKVRNVKDGTVEIEAEGEEGLLKKLLDYAHRGPSIARVDKVEHTWQDNLDEFNDFKINY